MAYPEWVAWYKTKGTYVQKRGEKYFLYRGHSERVAGKRYPVLKYDAYLGQITEAEGLIEPKPPVRPGVQVYTYGAYYLTYRCCWKLLQRTNHDGNEPRHAVMIALMQVVSGQWSREEFQWSWLSVKECDVVIPQQLSEREERQVPRLVVMVEDMLKRTYGEGYVEAFEGAKRVYLVRVNNQWVISEIPKQLQRWAEEQAIRWEVE